MTTKLSTAVIRSEETVDGLVSYYVRSVRAGRPSFGGWRDEHDAWAAYREVAIRVPDEIRRPAGLSDSDYLRRVEGLSDAPRATPDAAAEDMWQAVAIDLEQHPCSRLQHGTLPDTAQPVGLDPLGDEP